jgi:AraC-like DNA-binding protein
MTTNAKELTGRASPPQPAAQVRPFGDALTRLGYNVPALLAPLGLTPGVLNDPDALVPRDALARLLRAAAEQRRITNLAARIAFHTALGAYPLLDYLVATTDTVGDALRQLVRYFHLVGAPVRVDIVEEPDAVRLVLRDFDPFMAEYEAAIAIHHLREESQQRLQVSFVSLPHEPEDPRDLERLLGCAVRAPAAWSGIEFPKDAMATSLRRRDPVLRRVLEGSARQAAVAPHATGNDAADRVRAALTSRVGGRLPEMSEMARQLAMAPRTLQRRLAAEGVSYKELLDEARRTAAERLLVDRSLTVAEVGYLLGFSEPSAFHRAFKRWHDVTPLEFRGQTKDQ